MKTLQQEAEEIRLKYVPNGFVNLKGKGLGDGKKQFEYEKQIINEMLIACASGNHIQREKLDFAIEQLERLYFEDDETSLLAKRIHELQQKRKELES